MIGVQVNSAVTKGTVRPPKNETTLWVELEIKVPRLSLGEEGVREKGKMAEKQGLS